jgi:hypothetical protein
MLSAPRWRILTLAVLVLPNVSQAQALKSEAELLDTFERKVRPILANNCYNCHSAANKSSGGLRVDDRNGLIQGGNRGSAVVPGHPEKSLLIQVVKHAHQKVKMPPGKQLDAEDIAVLAQWITDGAAWPKAELPPSIGRYAAKYERLRKEHWSFQPLGRPPAPQVNAASWPRDDIDRFVLAQLEAKNLAPVRDADAAALLRRLTFDLTGLPPTPAEIEAFLKDTSPDAYAKTVDRLLASAAFGERWGRHWLDVARYGESSGSSRNLPLPHAWRYRDYVIDAFNKDTPYDHFLRQQIAGDLLPAKDDKEADENIIATGFLALGVKDVNQRFKVRFVMDNVDEQIDTVSRSVLGLTASCARCHDHKFDPIPTNDYYALAGIFTSSDLCSGLKSKMGGGGLDYYEPILLMPLPSTGKIVQDPETLRKVADLTKKLEIAREEFEAIRGTPEGKALGANGKPKQQPFKKKVIAAQNELYALADPAAKGHAVMGVRDAQTVGDTEIRIRGEAEKLGPLVARGFLTAIDVPGAPPVNPKQSGRRELAEWLASRNNPLTPRVMVNRVWQHLFGRGLVSSVDNFGINGDTPSHPELLDHLANRFIDDGWSVKKLVRAVVLTRSYQLSSDATPEHLRVDPANRFVWRHTPRRLEAEEIRDAILVAGGQLQPGRPTSSPVKQLKVMEMRNNGPEARVIEKAAAASTHRSVYLPLVRGLVPRPLEVFDFAEQGMVTGQRDATTVAPQALFMLNDPLVRKQSLAFAERLLKAKQADDTGRIQSAYVVAFGRHATPKEVDRAGAFLTEFEGLARQSSPPQRDAATLPSDPPTATVPPKVDPLANPDDADQSDDPIREVTITISDPRTAAWAAFCQSLLGSAEFRFLR